MNITLKQLKYFAALARHHHFGRAADECAISQPALSLQIQELERSLGAPLVERRRLMVALTPLGQDIATRARNILATVHDLADLARQHDEILTGALRLGVIPSLAPYILPRALPLLRHSHPGLILQLREAQTRYLTEELLEGQLDAVLLSLPLADQRLDTVDLFEDRLLLVTAPDDHHGEPASLNEINPDTLLLLEEGHCLRDQALAYCTTRDTSSPRPGAASLATIIHMVANGYGSTLLPEIALATELRGGPPVSVRAFVAPQPSRKVALAWRTTSPRRRDFLALAEVLVTAARQPTQVITTQ